MMRWHPRRILLVTRDNDALAAYLGARKPVLQFRARTPEAVTADDLAWADAYLGPTPPAHGDLGTVRWVHSPFAGVDTLLTAAPRWPEGTLLTRTTGRFGERIGEYCLARALAVCQQLPALIAAQQQRTWAPRPLRYLRGSRVAILGTGTIGTGIARAFNAAGCTVVGISRRGLPRPPFAQVFPVTAIRQGLADAGWVILTLPLTDATAGLVGRETLAACQGAFLMNVGRGAVVEEDALITALQDGTLAGAALDVFETEPLPPSSPLWALPNVLISPHMAALTLVEEMGDSFLDALDDIEQGRRPGLAVNLRAGY